jgi:hypothetical protein
MVWAMTARQWERVESARRQLRDSSYARQDPAGQVWRSVFGEGPLVEATMEPLAIVYWSFAQLAFIGEWLPRGRVEAMLGGSGDALGLSPAEITLCFDHVLEIVEQVGLAGPGSGD